MSYLDNLNERQKQAAEHQNGPLLIVAGAGAGKTKTIAARIVRLVQKGVRPENILAITFTNKAAKEMRARVEKALRSEKSLNRPISLVGWPFVSTFHSLGVHILRENARSIGLNRHFGIFDRGDSKKSIRQAMEIVGVNPKQFEPGKILEIISREKGNNLLVDEYEAGIGNEYLPGIIAKIWRQYDKILAEEKALDFDDLLLRAVRLLKSQPAILEKYQSIWHYLLIDEYQDTNKIQYELAKFLAEKSKNICAVGDTDQCLLPGTKIKTPTGEKEIGRIKIGQKITGAAGDGEVCSSLVNKVIMKKYDGKILEIITKNGKKIKTTPGHILFARLTLTKNKFYVYLMYRRDKGFRIGLAKSVRQDSRGKKSIGLLVRCNQEKADKMWVLKICRTKREASYWEIFFSSKYGLPTVVFLTCGRRLSLEQDDINKIFKEIDTKKRAEKLFRETGMNFNYPHYFPQGTTKSNVERNRLNINLNMFGDRRKSLINPWGMSRVSINTTELNFKKKLIVAGFKTKKGKREDWRLDISRLDYGEIEKIATKIQKLKGNLTIVRNAFITKGKKMLFQPASNIIPGMVIGITNGRKIEEEKVISVTQKHYRGKVYDLNVDKIHNYIAGNIVVHNCIYGWRGASIRNLLEFEKDYPNTTLILLEENYRSSKRILEVANRVIEKNRFRHEKKLFTQKPLGEKIGIYAAYDETDEANYIAGKAQSLVGADTLPQEIAVLYRANFQSRAIEEAFLNEKIPYQVLGTRFFERKEVKDILAYIKAALNPENLSDFKRAIENPRRGVGKVTLAKALSGMEEKLPAAARQKIGEFRNLLGQIKKQALSGKASETIKFVLRVSGIEAQLKSGGDDERERLENIRELASLAVKYDGLPPEEGMEKLLTDATLASDQDELQENKPAVKLMTVHSAKGLEFDYVFITGLEDGLFPHERLGEKEINEEEGEEERRLFYVALTRARKKIFLSHTSIRTIFGSRQVNLPSEFFADIDREHLEEEYNLKGAGKIIYL